jgi:hypothetical protein
MSGFSDGYSRPGPIEKVAGTWHSQTEPNTDVGGIDSDSDSDTDEFLKAHGRNYDDVEPDQFLSDLDVGGQCDEGGMHLNCCAAHLAAAKKAWNCNEGEKCGKALNSAMYHFKHFHKALKRSLGQ